MAAAHAPDLRAAAVLGVRPVFVRRAAERGDDAPAAESPALDGVLEPDGLVHPAETLGC